MASDFDRILDECIDRITRGETVEACLSDYPERANQLAPLLQVMVQTKASYPFMPSADNKRAARQRFYAALERTSRPSLLNKVLARRLVWASLATLIVVLVVGYVALRTTIFPSEPPSITIPESNAEGNFVFLVSDEVNAIADFSDLNVTVDKVGLLQTSNSKRWVEFTPELKEFDLALLPGVKTRALWRGNIPEGDYSKEVIYWKPEGQSTTCLHVGECKGEVFISFFKLFLPSFRSSEA